MAKQEFTVQLTVDPVFSGLYVIQRAFQARLHNGILPMDMAPDEKMAYIRTQFLALADEQHEALAETGWKPWATSTHLNRDAYMGELADTFIFLMNQMLVADITPSQLMDVVKAKQIKNAKRQDENYDGVTTKCPGCKRAYDDDAVKCTSVGTVGPNGPALIDSAFPEPRWCDQLHGYINEDGSVIE
jgi:hypothetical protein